ncbi:RNA helicase, activating signal cointegrator 1 [Haematococcus lacustris]
MADKGGRGGGAEQAARFKQYDYRANSSLVLTSENRTRDAHDPSGEPESLWGRMRGKMGDRVQYTKAQGVEEKKKKKDEKDAKKKRAQQESADDFGLASNKRGKQGSGVGGSLSVMDIDNANVYRPKTKETREAYEALLALIHQQFGEQPQDVLRGAADEVLAVLKAGNKKDPEKQVECEELLGPLPADKFASLVTIGKLITDWVSEADAPPPDNPLDTELGVGVQFDDEDESDGEDEGDVVVDEDDEDDDENGGKDASITADLRTAMDVDAGEEARDDGLRVQEIDAYWLQRRIARAFGDAKDANALQELAEQVLAVLGSPADARTVENELVMALGFEKFELIKELLRNRLKLVWCTRLSRAQDDEERSRIETEMAGSQECAAILDALRATRTSARERQNAMERTIREEARRLRGEGGTGPAVVDEATDAASAEDMSHEGTDRPGRRGPAVKEAAQVAARQVVDLESLAFNQGGHFKSNKTTNLPEGSFRSNKKGYDEVHVPALKPKPFAAGEKLVAISSLPEWMQPAFANMKELNRVQSRVCESALYSSENMLVCAPTGAGKTNVAMLRDDGSFDKSAFKIVYVAPMKALVAEMVGNFSKRLEPFGMSVRELTGDINLSKAEIEETQVIVTTPEKWDIITRKSDDRTYANLVRLLIIDEIHLLHDDRGPVLESIVARTIRQVEATQEMTRIVGLSATLPNYEDVADFLRVKADKGLFYFDNTYRPCPLAQQYVGVNVKKALQRFQLMNEICYGKVLECAGKHQVLVFVHSRKETAKTARYVKEQALKEDKLARFMKEDSASREILTTEAEACKNADLRDLLPYGFAIHHAGMTRADRTLVEDLFADGHVQVLVSTATLAWGVNLPAHTVIIKGTQVYNPVKGAWDELSPQDVMQMMGRAGRPQYDSFGEGIIITGAAELQFYLSLFNQQLPIESQYVRTIADNLNAEVVLGSVTNLKDAAAWLGYSYLFVRMLRAPALYGVPLTALDTDPLLLDRRMDLAHTGAVLLDKHGLLRYDRKTGNMQATDLGRIASHYYVTYHSIAAFRCAADSSSCRAAGAAVEQAMEAAAVRAVDHLKPTMGDIELLRLFSLADEFKYMVVRDEEKVELAKLVERVPIPVKEGLDEPSAKINVLLQAYVSCLKLEGLALSSDMVYVTQSAGRLMRCLFEICLKRGWAGLTDRALALCKMVNHRQWGSQNPLRQFKGLPQDLLTKLEKRDIPWDRYYDMSSQELGELVRMPKHGKQLHKLVHQFPRLQLAAQVQPVTRGLLKIDLTITPDFKWEDKVHGFVEPWWVLVEDQDSERLLHHQYWVLKKAFCEDEHVLSFTVPVSEPLPPQYFVRLVSDRWLQCETTLPVSFSSPPPTELLDLQPLPVTALRNPAFEALYKGLSSFNPVQTQCFSSLYNTDDNCLVAAPTGSGKTIAAELAVLRMLARAAEGKCNARCVYVAPMAALAKERMADWSKKFGEGLGINVVELTGETAADLKLLERGNIVISSAEQWDMLSRRWKQRKAVQGVALFIVDELHLIGGPQGPVLEVVCSRMRYVAAQTESAIRIVGLGHSMADAKDVGDWLGTPTHALFAFAPGVRPVPLEVHIQGLDIHNFEARMQAMSRPAYSAVSSQASRGRPALVFVPTRKHARLLALDLLTAAAADGEPARFRLADAADVEPFLGRVRDPALKHSLAYGVGLMTETQSDAERAVVNLLFESGAIQVIVATAATCWGMTAAAQLVVVCGTQFYDGAGAGQSDYPVTDIIQMIGRAGRPNVDDAGRVLLLCHAPRKDYYKRFLLEALPVESHLDHVLHDHFNAEVVTRTIENKQDAVDYLTWTLFYRRLGLNPNFYGMAGASHRHLSDHLSELAISIEDDMDLAALNLGMIAAYYYISYTTIEVFSSSLTAKTKMKGMLEIISAASEFDAMAVRPGEEEAVRKLVTHAPLALDAPRLTDPHTKCNALLQAHFSRTQLAGDLALDAREVVAGSVRLLLAAVDVVASSGWLSPALVAMEMSQMVTQGLWDKDSPLMQLPHISKELAARCTAQGCASVFDLIDMEEDARRELLALSDPQLAEVSAACSRYPDIQMSHELASGPSAAPGEPCTLVALLEREGLEAGQELGPVVAPRFPARKDEGWWLVLGDAKANSLLAIKRVTLAKAQKVKLDFSAPASQGKHKLTLYLMCDSWTGCDQEYEVDLVVEAGGDAMDA